MVTARGRAFFRLFEEYSTRFHQKLGVCRLLIGMTELPQDEFRRLFSLRERVQVRLQQNAEVANIDEIFFEDEKQAEEPRILCSLGLFDAADADEGLKS